MRARHVLELLCEEHLGPSINHLGFHRQRKNTFQQKRIKCVCRINLDTIRRSDSGLIIVYLGIGFRQIAEFLQPLEFLRIGKADVRNPTTMVANIGHLLQDPEWKEWLVTPDTDLSSFGPELAGLIEECAPRYFDDHDTLQKLVAAIQSGRTNKFNICHKTCTLCAACWLLGDRDHAMAMADRRYRIADRRARSTGKAVDHESAAELLRLRSFLEAQMKGAS